MAFTATAFGVGAFLGFFFSLLCEWLTFPTARTSFPEGELARARPICPWGNQAKLAPRTAPR